MNEPAPNPPISTIPVSTQIQLRGFNECKETQDFIAALSDILMDCSEMMDLSRLAGVTVGFDFHDAVQSVELGFESTHAKSYTNDGDFVCVGKAMNVIRDGVVMSHVVYNANLIAPVSDPDHADFLQATHIIAHELGHVAELKWRDEALPGVMLKYRSPDSVNALLLQVALAIWEEYAACRLTSLWGDQERQTVAYAASFDMAAENALPRAQTTIRKYRLHGDVDKLLDDAGKDLAPAIKALGYLLGHVDGSEMEVDLAEMSPKHMQTIYRELTPQFHQELRDIWNTRESWAGMEVFDGLKRLTSDVFRAAGMDIRKQGKGHYVDVPFTPQTMPFG
jgi:hypothetical protein